MLSLIHIFGNSSASVSWLQNDSGRRSGTSWLCPRTCLLYTSNKLGALTKAGDHFYFRNPMPASSWADGTRVLIGESAIDFDMTLKAVDSAAGTAVLVVKHVPPEKSAVKLPAAWMQTPVGDAPNNWVGVQKEQNGTYTASVGEETFTDEIKVSLADGKILDVYKRQP